MKKAIAVPYTPYQNSPSVPLDRLVEVPNELTEEFLQSIVDEFFETDDDDIDTSIVVSYDSGWGDISLIVGNDLIYVYLTFIEE